MKKPNDPTASQILFKDRTILNERPEGMTYEEYRELRKHQTKVLKMLHKRPSNKKISQFVDATTQRIKKIAFRSAIRTQRKVA